MSLLQLEWRPKASKGRQWKSSSPPAFYFQNHGLYLRSLGLFHLHLHLGLVSIPGCYETKEHKMKVKEK